MEKMRKFLTRQIAFTLSICLATTGLLPAWTHAQSGSSDFEAPIIEHEQIETGVLGDAQVFTATVVDNDQLADVSFNYRFSGENAFVSIQMEQLPSLSLYSVTVETEGSSAKSIEYYIQAEDVSGNVILKGFSFDPLVRVLESDSSSAVATQDPTSGPDVTGAEEPKKKSKVLYYVLGVLAVGAIAAAAGGGSDGGGGGDPVVEPPECVRCSVTISIAPF